MTAAHGTVLDVLVERAEQDDGRTRMTLLSGTGDPPREMTWSELLHRAAGVAAGVRERVKPGDRAVLVHSDPLEFAIAMLGCLMAGVIAVPAFTPEPARMKKTGPRLEAISRSAEATVVLCSGRELALAGMLRAFAPTLAAAEWLGTDQMPSSGDVRLERTEVAYLQYTSGSTARARGVIVGHAQLMGYLVAQARRYFTGPENAWVCWLPVFHDMGLLSGVLNPLYCDTRTVLMTPLTFLERPVRWLEAITTHRGTGSCAPNFAFDLCIRKTAEEDRAGLDLSSWRFAVNGAEPIQPRTVREFIAAFAPHGFREEAMQGGYGLAEAVVGVALGTPGRRVRTDRFDVAALKAGRLEAAATGEVRELAASGEAVGDMVIRVVDPATGEVRADGEVGEIWVAGGWICEGYWRDEELTRATFGARLPGDDRLYLRTGDLGAMLHGQLWVTGRLKDMLVLRGDNHYPQDIELAVQEASRVVRPGCVAAASFDGPDGEDLLIVAETKPADALELAGALDDILRNVATREGVRPAAIGLVAAGELPKTSSGKVQRSGARDAYFAGDLEVLAAWPQQ